MASTNVRDESTRYKRQVFAEAIERIGRRAAIRCFMSPPQPPIGAGPRTGALVSAQLRITAQGGHHILFVWTTHHILCPAVTRGYGEWVHEVPTLSKGVSDRIFGEVERSSGGDKGQIGG